MKVIEPIVKSIIENVIISVFGSTKPQVQRNVVSEGNNVVSEGNQVVSTGEDI